MERPLPPVDLPRIAAAVREILEAIGEDPDRDGLLDTPMRVARMYEEVFAGLRETPDTHLQVMFEANHDEMVMVRDIPLTSMCEHHLVPFIGKAHVAYIPGEDGRVTGLSKLAAWSTPTPSGPRSRSASPRRSPTRSSARSSPGACSW
jgi:GTP cyclohydrolase I